MRKHTFLTIVLAALLAACGSTSPHATPETVSVYASSAAYPWLDEVYNCAPAAVVIRLADPGTAQISLRLGPPDVLTAPAFQIGSDDLLVVVQPQVGVGSLNPNQVTQLFSGQVTQWKDLGGSDLPVEVWTYSTGVDIQAVFDRTLMQGEPITSTARLAVSAQVMSDAVGSRPGAVGFLPRRWKAGNTNSVLTIASVPVLAISDSIPEGAVRQLIGCLQPKE